MAETCCNIRKHYGLPKRTHGYSCPSLCAEPKVIYGLFYSWLYIPLCAASVWAVRSFLEQNCLGPFFCLSFVNYYEHTEPLYSYLLWNKETNNVFWWAYIALFLSFVANCRFIIQYGQPFVSLPWQVHHYTI